MKKPPEIADRSDPAVAERLIRQFLPSDESRGQALAALARAITAAQMTNPASWSVNLYVDEVKLNVGQLAVIHIRPRRFGCMITPSELRTVNLADVSGYEPYGEMTWIPGTLWGFLSEDHISSYRLLEAANLALVRQAAGKQKEVRKQSRDTHAPGILEYLRREGHAVPDPSYEARTPASASKGTA